jgi:hypothetical protein
MFRGRFGRMSNGRAVNRMTIGSQKSGQAVSGAVNKK